MFARSTYAKVVIETVFSPFSYILLPPVQLCGSLANFGRLIYHAWASGIKRGVDSLKNISSKRCSAQGRRKAQNVLKDQLTLFQPGQVMPTTLILLPFLPWIFKPSYDPAAQLWADRWGLTNIIGSHKLNGMLAATNSKLYLSFLRSFDFPAWEISEIVC